MNILSIEIDCQNIIAGQNYLLGHFADNSCGYLENIALDFPFIIKFIDNGKVYIYHIKMCFTTTSPFAVGLIKNRKCGVDSRWFVRRLWKDPN